MIDTSPLSPHAFKQLLAGHFALGRSARHADLSVMSFSYRHGLPREADLVFDVRFLANPALRAGAAAADRPRPGGRGLHRSDPGFRPFIDSLKGLLGPLLPRFDAEGKSYLTIAVGCTGGRHRSVFVAEELAAWLRGDGPLGHSHAPGRRRRPGRLAVQGRATRMIGIVLVTHGRLAREFIAALEHVVGPQQCVSAVCIGADDDMEKRRAEILERVSACDTGDGVVVLTDMFGGTPSNLAISIMEQAASR